MRIVKCERCGWIGRETEIKIPAHCPDCCDYGGLMLCDSHQEYSIDELRFLWEQFEDIPINDADEIDEEYMGWPVGTDRFDIWHWFDARWPKGVYNLVYKEHAANGDDGFLVAAVRLDAAITNAKIGVILGFNNSVGDLDKSRFNTILNLEWRVYDLCLNTRKRLFLKVQPFYQLI